MKARGASVATTTEVEALARRISALESRRQSTGSAWLRLSASPLGARKRRRLIAAGKLEAARVGRLLLVRIEDHDALLAARIIRREKLAPGPVLEAASAQDYAAANLHLLRGGNAA